MENDGPMPAWVRKRRQRKKEALLEAAGLEDVHILIPKTRNTSLYRINDNDNPVYLIPVIEATAGAREMLVRAIAAKRLDRLEREAMIPGSACAKARPHK